MHTTDGLRCVCDQDFVNVTAGGGCVCRAGTGFADGRCETW
jgi:hypothetical protein